MEFSLLGLLVILLIGAICGALGQAIAGYSLGGLLASIAVGLIGALIGTWLANQLGLPELFTITVDGQTIPIVWTIIGATIFALIIGLIRRPNRRRR